MTTHTTQHKKTVLFEPVADPEPGPPDVQVRGVDVLVLQAASKEARWTKWRRWLPRIGWNIVGPLIAVVLFVAVAYALHRAIEEITWADVLAAIGRISWAAIGLSAAATAASYLALAVYDILALRQVGARQVPLSFAVLTSFIAQSFTFTLGFGVLTGSAVRMRLYQSRGMSVGQILAVGALCSITFWMGLAAIGGLCLLIEPGMLALVDHFAPHINTAAGLIVLGVLAGWIVYSAAGARSFTFSGWELRLPGPFASLGSMAAGIADTSAAALALWFLLPNSGSLTFPAFLVVFILATILGVISHVPGGLGIFEATLLLGLPQIPQADLIGSLLLFRIIYYLSPFLLSALLFTAYEIRGRHQAFTAVARLAADTAKPFLPAIAAGAVFIGGFILLVSGSLPAIHDRMTIVKKIIPLPFVETSHFIASIVGALLLMIAHGLANRLRSAWRMAIFLLFAAAIFSVIKGFDYEEATICLAVILLLWMGRGEFYRRAGLFDSWPSARWLAAAIIAAGAAIWIGFNVYQHVEYQNSLWWEFAYREDVPRFLRATLGIAVTGILFAAYSFLHSAHPMSDPASAEEMARAAEIVKRSPRSEAHLALLGDKRFLFSEKGDGFVMYAVQGTSWIAMGDPISLVPDGVAALVWRYKELVDQHRGTPVFYQVSTNHLPAYLDAGFSLVKLGEEAWVDLSRFTLDGSEGRKLRQTKARAERTGAALEIVPPDKIEQWLPDLKRVSDAWLAGRRVKEKGFSLGFWQEDYLKQCEHAIVRHGGAIVAFANIWKGSPGGDYSVDLMRHTPEAPPSVMDLLFIGLMERAKDEGYRWFNLGMAPLSGMPAHRLATRWSRIGALIYRHADRFYNFEGVRAFKSKFKPEWRPKYLAYPGGLSLPQILMNVTALISSSSKRVSRVAEAA